MPATVAWIAKWKNGVIPYVANPTHPFWNQIVEAMEEFHRETNMRFVIRTHEPDYVVFTNDQASGNHAPLGKSSGEHGVNIVSNVRQVHELGHLIGLIHEHQRSDRDDHLDFDYSVIDSGKKDWTQETVLNKYQDSVNFGPFDINSVMIYWTSAGGKRADTGRQLINFLNNIVLQEKADLFNGEHRVIYWKSDKNHLFDTPSKLSRRDAEGINRILYPPNEITLPFFQFREICNGNQIKLMHINTKCILHSHPIQYKTGSRQQEVTCYWRQDDNDWFKIHRKVVAEHAQIHYNEVLGLEHVQTGNWLHSHSGPGLESPVTKQQEVTCFFVQR